MPSAFSSYSAIIAAMAEWDLDSPVKRESSRDSQDPSADGPGVRQPVTHPLTGAASPPGGRPTVPVSPAAASTAASSRRRRVRFSYVWLGIAVAMLLIGIAAGFLIDRSEHSGDTSALAAANARVNELQSALTRSEDRNWTYYRLTQGLQEQLTQATSPTSAITSTPTTAAPSTSARRTYGEGLYLVGEDIPPGTYDGTPTSSVGYWARLKATDGAISSIIENGITRGPFVLTIDPSDMAVELRGVTLTKR
jgi:hypothetical protein